MCNYLIVFSYCGLSVASWMHHSDAKIIGLCCLFFPELYAGQEHRIGRVVGVFSGHKSGFLRWLNRHFPWLVEPLAVHGVELCLPSAHPTQGEDGWQRALVKLLVLIHLLCLEGIREQSHTSKRTGSAVYWGRKYHVKVAWTQHLCQSKQNG